MSDETRPPVLAGDEGNDLNRYFDMRAHSAERTVVVEADGGAGKPSIAVLSNGDILVSYVRNYDVGALKVQGERMEIVRSSDGGKTWSEPVRATRSNHNDREGYLIPFADDTLLLCFMRVMQEEDPARPWQGPYLCESTDGGRTWSDEWQVDISRFCSGPFGAGDRGHVVLPNGRLLLFVSTYEDPPRPFEFVMVSDDKGRTFTDYHQISDKSGDGSFTLCSDGSIAGTLRINADDYPYRGAHPELAAKSETVHFMAFTRSLDEGKTWSEPLPVTGYNEIPGHITELADGRLLLTFGVRHYPLGVQAVLTKKDGLTWDLENRLMLAWHGGMHRLPNGYCRHTIGHPYTKQLPDGRLFTAYYRLEDPFDGASCRIEGLFWDPPPITG